MEAMSGNAGRPRAVIDCIVACRCVALARCRYPQLLLLDTWKLRTGIWHTAADSRGSYLVIPLSQPWEAPSRPSFFKITQLLPIASMNAIDRARVDGFVNRLGFTLLDYPCLAVLFHAKSGTGN